MEKDLTDKINRLIKIGIALSNEKDFDKFCQMILKEAVYFTNSDAGTIYWLDEDKKILEFKYVCTLSKNINIGRANNLRWPDIPLYDSNGDKLMNTFVSYVTHTAKPQSIDDVYSQDVFDNSGTKMYDIINKYKSVSMAAIPLKNHEDEVLGVIQLINAMDENGNIIRFSEEAINILSSLSSQVAVAMTNKLLIHKLETLLKEFMQLIAFALDRKSKFSGGHIERVTVLTEMFAQKLQEDDKKFKNIHLTEDELEELSLSGWMHDIGKITTPDFIIHKASKLEKTIDRSELIKLRIDLVKMAIQNDMLKKQKKSYEEEEKIINELDKFYEFLIKINAGDVAMNDEDYKYLDKIYNFEYKSEGKIFTLLTDDEKRNLSIKKGTLLPEEYRLMREHVLVSYKMLSKLSFPKKYKNLTNIATAHHEKLNGKGYPFGKKADELSIQARILAITDFFEALTANDRPYKKGKTLSESLKILAKSAQAGEIDKDLLDLFLETGIYDEYAKKYLSKVQIDSVDKKRLKSIIYG